MSNTGTVPASSGIGAPGTDQAPASLARSPMSSSPGAAAAIPFTRGSSLATMQDYSGAITTGQTLQIQLQTNAFLENIVLDVSGQTVSNAATVAYVSDGPFAVIQSIKLDDPAGQSIIAPITGFQLYCLNKYLPDTDCFFDALKDPEFQCVSGAGTPASTSNGGSFNFRLVIPVEIRRRDAFGALNNSAANTRYLLTITAAAFGSVGTSNLYATLPTTTPVVTLSVFQQYWTSPPSAIVTSQGSVGVQVAPPGLGSVGFVRFEQHSEVSGGGTPQIQLNNVGDYIEQIQWTLRTTNNNSGRDPTTVVASVAGTSVGSGGTPGANWPTSFQFWVNDFETHYLQQNEWARWMQRFFGYSGAYGNITATQSAGVLDAGVWIMFMFHGLFDRVDNYAPAGQFLATDATTKLQVRGSNFGTSAGVLQVVTRNIRPVSGAALFS
jgi:hypothetical protein